MEILAQFPYQKYVHSQANETHLVLTLTAPALDWEEKRPNLAIIPAIDVSGSMAGDKLEYAKKSALKMVDHMKDDDVMGLVIFESQVRVIVKPGKLDAERRNALRAEISKLRPMGGTNFEGGMSSSIKLLNDLDLPPSYLARVIMFTDGQPTSGIHDKGKIRQILKANRDRVTVSAFGYGVDDTGWGCDQEFLTGLAEDGAGNYALIENPDEALAAFGKELGGLVSTYATDLTISVEPIKGHRVASVVSDVDAEEQDVTGVVDIKVPDILSEETRHLVLKVNLDESTSGPRQVGVFNVKARWTIITEEGKREDREGEAKASVQFVRKDVGEENKDLRRIINLAELARAQIEAEAAVQKGDYSTAGQIFDQYVVQNSGVNEDVALIGAVNNLRAGYASSQNYAASAGLRHGTRRGITRGMGISSMDADARLQVQSLGLVSGSNEAQTSFSAAFSEGSSGSPPVGSAQPSVNLGAQPVVNQPLVVSSDQWRSETSNKVELTGSAGDVSSKLTQKRSDRTW